MIPHFNNFDGISKLVMSKYKQFKKDGDYPVVVTFHCNDQELLKNYNVEIL